MTAPARPTCSRCGEPVTPGARFCMKCGTEVSDLQGAVATAMMPAAAHEPDANEALLELLRSATIGEYEVLRELGRGGMATVYLGHDIALDRKVAIKVMAPALLLMGEGMSERFKREARTAANLSHPNIIPIYTVKSAGKTLFFVMKFIAGRSLEAIIHDTGPMPIPMARAILQQVGGALGYAHRNGIIHRDVKPANIMIDEEGWAVVTDFGIAKVAENRGLTMTGIAVGTPSYMSPEQCAAKDITGKSDQYSLGIVAYEMLTGHQPFQGDSAMAIMYAHFNEQPRSLLELRPDCPAEVAAVVMRMLEKSPDKRWPSMEEAMAALGVQPMAHDDPMHRQLQQLARRGSNSELLRTVPPPPTSPVPPARTRPIVEDATTPIPAPRVVGLAVAPEQGEVFAGESLQLVATPRVVGGTSPAGVVSWSSSNTEILSVNTAGLVTGQAPGSATVTATLEGIQAVALLSVRPVPVATVRVDPIEPVLVEGESWQLHAVVLDRNGAPVRDRTVRWSASPRGLLEVTTSGLVTAKQAGVAEVAAECEGVRGLAKVRIEPPAVASVAVTPAEGSVLVGEALTLSAEPRDGQGKPLAGREVSWRSAAVKLATVSARGAVTGVAEGTVEIIAECEGRKGTAKLLVKPAPVATVTVAEPAPLASGGKVQLEAVLKDAHGRLLTGRTIKWSSSSPGVATVTQAGQLTGMGAGSAKITAECEGKSWTVRVTVEPKPEPKPKPVVAPPPPAPPPAPASVSEPEVATEVMARRPAAAPPPAPAPVVPAGNVPARAEPTPRPAEVPAVPSAATPKVEVEAPKAAPVGGEARASGGRGKLVGAVAGVLVLAVLGYLVFGRGTGGEIPSAPPAPVIETASVARVELAGDGTPLAVGRTQQLSALLRGPAGEELNGRAVAWSSSDPAVATVSEIGAVTARKTGSVTISAASEGKTGSVTLTVVAPDSDLPAAVASVAIAGPPSHTVDIGETSQLQAALKDAKGAGLEGRTIVWSSSDPAVVLVSSAGLVTAVGPGGARVSAGSEGKSAEVRFTVRPPKEPEPPPVVAPVAVAAVALAPTSASVAEGSSTQLTATAFDAGRKALGDRAIGWKSADERIATVNAAGLVTGVAAGSTTITATVEGKSATARLSVTEPPPSSVPVAAVTLAAGTRSLKVGEKATWSAVARDQRGRDLGDRGAAWSSSDPRVATVDGAGVISAVGAGSAEIRVTVGSKRASERITVTAAPAPPPVAVTAPPAGAPAPAGGAVAGGALLPRRSVEAGGGISCGIASGGAVCWGAGNGLTLVGGTAGITGLTVGRGHACGLLSGGRAVCWGDNRVGQLGDGGTGTGTSLEAVEVAGGRGFSAISAGGAHTCALAGGKAFCWGRNKDGQLGDGSGSDRRRPVAVRGGLSFTAIAAGGDHSCALTAAGKAYCWGDGYSGQLGFGAQESQGEPIDVSGNQKFARIAAGGKHTCALAEGGKAFCWGGNESGQVGDGSKSDRTRPQAVMASASFTDVVAGGSHSCGLTAGGELLCWGDNKAGQLGDGTKASRDKPVAAGGGLSFAGISAGEAHTCGLTRGGEPVCWGRNDKMQLGDGGTTPRSGPAPVRERR